MFFLPRNILQNAKYTVLIYQRWCLAVVASLARCVNIVLPFPRPCLLLLLFCCCVAIISLLPLPLLLPLLSCCLPRQSLPLPPITASTPVLQSSAAALPLSHAIAVERCLHPPPRLPLPASIAAVKQQRQLSCCCHCQMTSLLLLSCHHC
jgi:hypothetical protein